MKSNLVVRPEEVPHVQGHIFLETLKFSKNPRIFLSLDEKGSNFIYVKIIRSRRGFHTSYAFFHDIP